MLVTPAANVMKFLHCTILKIAAVCYNEVPLPVQEGSMWLVPMTTQVLVANSFEQQPLSTETPSKEKRVHSYFHMQYFQQWLTVEPPLSQKNKSAPLSIIGEGMIGEFISK